jgi:L,D-peptidoglycan transpeptidase YkuD (ErfK/YbiS/YcfS/YnhG family)
MRRFFNISLFIGLLASAAACAAAKDNNAPWTSDGTQLLVVIPADWQSPNARLHSFERVGTRWLAKAPAFDVTIGKNGAAWGLGLHPAQNTGPQKVEGDGKAPAGIFALGQAFGYASENSTALGYSAMAVDDWCVDVNDSPYYNQLINTKVLGAAAASGSTEPMRRDIHLSGDMAYKKGFVIKHNANNVSRAGSCIFAHLWKAPGKATAGCTAMPEAEMDALLAWLDQRKNPVMVLLPEPQYKALRKAWHLPKLKN